jgi:hypothetical protein
LASAPRISPSADQSHPLNPIAPPATILDDVAAFIVGGASLDLHDFVTCNAAQEICQRTFIVIQM